MNKISLLERIRKGDRLVCDGAMGSWLIRKGMAPGECPEALNLTHPEWIEEILGAYLDAGADILETNTFGASPLKLSQYGLDGKTEEINTKAVAVARGVARDEAYLAASCGPCGKLLKPYGETDPEEVYESMRRQVKALRLAGVDGIMIETMTDLNEAVIAVKAAKAAAPNLAVTVTLTFDSTPKGFFTMMGDSVSKAAQELQKAGADVVGSNCGNGIEAMVKIAREFKKATNLPLLIQSNAGLPELKSGKLTYPETPEFFEPHVRELVALGISMIGGCCGTTPAHVRAIRRIIAA